MTTTNHHHKLSLEQAVSQTAKEYGLDSDTENQQQLIQQFYNIPFWRWDLLVKEHYELYRKGRCGCFNCRIEWPNKNGHVYPLFDYQHRYLSALDQYRLVACIKSRASGISEITLRYMEWLALRNRKLAGSQFIIVSAPAEETSLSFMRRIRAHLEPIFGNFESREKTLVINDVRFQTMPSHNLLQLRGITNVSFLALEESSFWHKNEESELLPIILPLRQKNKDIQIALISTPGAIGSLMHQIHLAPESETGFHKVYIDWRQVIGKLFTKEEIEIARRTNAAFAREYELVFGYATGNIFNSLKIEEMVKRGTELEQLRQNTIPYESLKILGCDPGYSSSKFGTVMLQLTAGGILEVVYSEERENADFNEMIREIASIYREYGVSKIYIDGSRPEFVKPLKQVLGDPHIEDYLEYQHRLEDRYPNSPGNYPKVIAVSFKQQSREMLAHTRRLLDAGALACSQTWSEIITAMMSAQGTDDDRLEKRLSAHNDILDSLMLACKHFSLPALSSVVGSSVLQALAPPPPTPPWCMPISDSSSSGGGGYNYRRYGAAEGSSGLNV
jgi:hypothetical protein